jgi:hypothetical protein
MALSHSPTAYVNEAAYLKATTQIHWLLIRCLPRDKTCAKANHPARCSMPRMPVALSVKVLQTNGYRRVLRGFLVGSSCTITVHSFRSADTRKSLNGVDISRALRWYNLVQLYTRRFARVTYSVDFDHVFHHAFYPLRCCPMSRGLCVCADPYCHCHTSWRDYHSIHYRDSLNHSGI